MDIASYLKNSKNMILTNQQINAIDNINSDILLLSVPGSGKTTCLVARVANIMTRTRTKPENILNLTFSKQASIDMKARFKQLFDSLIYESPDFLTIHSFCYRIIKDYCRIANIALPENIDASGYKKISLLSQINKKFNGSILSEDEIEQLSSLISYSKNMLITKSSMNSFNSKFKNFASIFEEYCAVSKQSNIIDFDDMLIYSIKILNKCDTILNKYSSKYRYINVDEAQDISKAQHKIINIIKQNNILFMVGDEDQTIYSFRGAYPQGILNFNKLYPNSVVLKMEQNFRSNSDIVEHANTFIKFNKNRYEKQMIANNNATNSISITNINDFHEQYDKIIEYICYNKHKCIAILYKYNESVLPILDKFINNNIEYKLVRYNNSFFNSFVVKDIISFLSLSFDPGDKKHFKNIQYKLYIKKEFADKIMDKTVMCDNLFDVFLSQNNLDLFIINKIQKFKKGIEKLKYITPVKAIEYIQKNLDYDSFISSKIKKGVSPESIQIKLSILKSLAYGLKDVQSFLIKLENLENNILQSENKKSNITLTTIHSSKGLEFDEVIIIDCIDGIFPSQKAIQDKIDGDIDAFEEEMRLFYVAITRSKSKLTIFTSEKLNDSKVKHSRFIDYLFNKSNPKLNTNCPNSKYQKYKIINQEVTHEFFGKGKITDISDQKVILNFDLFGEKALSLEYCIENNIISINKKEGEI